MPTVLPLRVSIPVQGFPYQARFKQYEASKNAVLCAIQFIFKFERTASYTVHSSKRAELLFLCVC